jgi:hypothetical protein
MVTSHQHGQVTVRQAQIHSVEYGAVPGDHFIEVMRASGRLRRGGAGRADEIARIDH